MISVGTDTENQAQQCSCLFLTKSTMGSSETFFFWRGTSELNGSGTGNGSGTEKREHSTVLEKKPRILSFV